MRDSSRNIRYANKAFQTAFGKTDKYKCSNLLKDCSLCPLCFPTDPKLYKNPRESLMSNNRSYLVHDYSFLDSDSTPMTLHIATDNSRQKELEKQLQRSRRNEILAYRSHYNLLADSSHELRTPLHSIYSYSRLASKKNKDEALKEYFDKIIRSGENLKMVISRLTSKANLSGNLDGYIFQSMPLAEALKNARTELQTSLDAKNITIHLPLSSRVAALLSVKIDGERMHHVFYEIISFLMTKLNIGNRIQLDIKTEVQENRRSLIHVIFQCDYRPEPELQKLPLFYKKLDSSSLEKKLLPLAICSEILNKHGGCLNLYPGEQNDRPPALGFSLPLPSH